MGKTVIVTGAGQGIGRVYAHRLARAGANVVVAELNEGNGQSVVKEITTEGGRALFVRTDVASESSCAAMADATVRAFDRVDGLVNNAAAFSTLSVKPFWELTVQEWDHVHAVNVRGVWLATRAVILQMQAQRFGRIINISSGVIFGGVPNYLHYVSSKGSVFAMTRAMARELGPWNITVNTIMPGVIRTEIERTTLDPARMPAIVARQCIQREETPEDPAAVVVFLCSDDAGFITGQTINVDGGLQMH